ncbi:MAG: NADP-dependent oxidoreductase, partial [Mesorhizobium sp.]
MMAWRVHEFGGPEVMRFEQIPRPNPGPGEVLIKVEAAGV